VAHGAGQGVVRAALRRGERELLVEIEINPGKANRVRVNRAPLPRPRELLGMVRTVLFAPEDLALVRGDPAERRRFLDELLGSRTPRLAGVRADYERVLKQRNALLKTARLARGDALATLDVWDGHLTELGGQLLAARLRLVADLAPFVADAYAGVAGPGADRAALGYSSTVPLAGDGAPVDPSRALPGAEALAAALREHFAITPLASLAELPPPQGDGPLELGYLDAHFRQPFRLTLKDQSIADRALEGFPDAYRRLDTAVLEALLLKGPLRLTDEDIDHQHGLTYSRTDEEATAMVTGGDVDLAFFLRPNPVRQVQEIAATGVNMPPKSTYFFPKVPTGLLFNPLT
jgi:hypothetical protein